jgi:hypothetical protein
MGYTWRSNSDGTADAVETDAFAEVVYENDQVLVVNVARGMLPDPHLENALVDALALEADRPDAEEALSSVARSFGLAFHPDSRDGHSAITIAPAGAYGPPGEGQP